MEGDKKEEHGGAEPCRDGRKKKGKMRVKKCLFNNLKLGQEG